MKPAPDHLAVALKVVETSALALAAENAVDGLREAILVFHGIQVAQRQIPVPLFEADAVALDAAHRRYSALLTDAIRGNGVPPLDHIVAVLDALESHYVDEVEDTATARTALLNLCWRAARNAIQLGKRPHDKTQWIVGGTENPNTDEDGKGGGDLPPAA